MTAQRDCHDCRSFVYCAEHSVQKSTSADPCLDAALRKLDALQAMHDAFVAEMGRQHADCEAKREAAERERDERTARLTELQRVIDTYAEDGATVVVKAGENGEVDMWSDGHAHAFAPLSSLRAAEARVVKLKSTYSAALRARDALAARVAALETAVRTAVDRIDEYEGDDLEDLAIQTVNGLRVALANKEPQ